MVWQACVVLLHTLPCFAPPWHRAWRVIAVHTRVTLLWSLSRDRDCWVCINGWWLGLRAHSAHMRATLPLQFKSKLDGTGIKDVEAGELKPTKETIPPEQAMKQAMDGYERLFNTLRACATCLITSFSRFSPSFFQPRLVHFSPTTRGTPSPNTPPAAATCGFAR